MKSQQLSYQMGDDQNVKQGNDIPTSYDIFIVHDLDQSIVLENKTLDSHYDHVMSSLGNSYNGANKFAYGNILQAIKTIVLVNKHILDALKSVKKQLHIYIKICPWLQTLLKT